MAETIAESKPVFDFNDKLKKNLFIMMGVGVLGIALILLQDVLSGVHNQHARLWSNLLANTYYFTGIGLFGLFAVAAGQLAYGSWHTLAKRIFLSLSAFTRIGGFLLALIIILGIFNVHSLYHHASEISKGTYKIDSIYTTKKVWFGSAFWISRVVIYAVLWFFFSKWMNDFFARTDQTDPKVYKRSKLLSAAFIVVFATTESFISWDAIMSLDVHWYSTLFGWYNFASYGCAAWAMTILIVIYLKSKGYIQRINENHVHDLGKLLFGFSIFWTYLWFDQFMLQWYANFPEETSFWVNRFDVPYFKATIFIALTINFFFPLFFLIKRGAKRNFKMIGFGAALLIVGHYIDFFNFTFVEPNWNTAAVAKAKEEKMEAINGKKVVLYAQAEAKKEESGATATDAVQAKGNDASMASEIKEEGNGNEKVASEKNVKGNTAVAHPEEEKEEPVMNYASIGIGEILVFIGFLGAFLFMFFNNLSKRPIIPENDPYLKENERLEVVYS